NRVRNITTTIIKNARPRDYILYTSVFLLLLSAIGYFFWYNNLRYDRAIASGKLNVLVVPFVEQHAWGYTESDLGWSLAQIFAEGLKTSYTTSGLETNVKILGPADKVPTIFGFNEDHLVHSAETVSEKINGQVVIYGVLSQDEYGDTVAQVKVYISPTNFGEAQELISDSMMGDLSLGSFVLTGETAKGADLEAQNEDLRNRLAIFASLINFLGAYLGDDFSNAQKYIEAAGDSILWNDPNGLEVIQLLQGNLELRRARVSIVQKDLEGTQASIDLARTYFGNARETALKNNKGQYARAYLGLAGAENLAAVAEANINGDPSAINTDALKETLALLEQAEQANYAPDSADVSVKANYGRAQVNLAYFAKTGNSDYLTEAKKYYQFVVEEYKRTDNKRIVDYTALSHSGLGLIASQENQVTVAIENFTSAYQLTGNPSLKIQCLVNMGDIYFANKMYAEALKVYQYALSRRNDLENAISAERIDLIEERINFIKNGGTL
ncbi:MAG TPA: hypothetical protein PKI33_10515, partial [Anaerolineales bacterium]|nr:hypothetical protein [Anaerolineales bacterium]